LTFSGQQLTTFIENIQGKTGRFLPTESEFEGDGIEFKNNLDKSRQTFEIVDFELKQGYHCRPACAHSSDG
jgi:hypothetical protein